MKCRTPMCAFFTTRQMRATKRSGTDTSASRSKKRSRMGTPKDRKLYISAHAHKHPDYSHLCARADRINNR